METRADWTALVAVMGVAFLRRGWRALRDGPAAGAPPGG
jgi:hypothetical protein